MPNHLRAKKAEKDGVSERDLIPREIRMFNYSSGGRDEAYDPSIMKHTQTPRYAMICKWIEQHHSNTSWNDQNAEIWKKRCVSSHGMGGCHRFWQPQPLLLILLCNRFSTIRSFSFESRFLGPNNYSTRLVRRITVTMWPLFSTVLHTISGLKIDHRLTMLYCVFSIPRLLFDFWWYIPHTPKKQRWDKSYPLSS